MLNPHSLEYEADLCHFDHVLSQWQQQWPLQDQVVSALREANAAFAAQFTQPDGYTYMQTCNELLSFLNIKVPLESNHQQLVVQVLQVACAMHENAVNNSALTPTQRSSHYLATTSLVPLCETALEHNITDPDLWLQAYDLSVRAQKAQAKAVEELDISKYLDFENPQYDPWSVPENDTDTESASGPRSPVPAPSRPVTPPPTSSKSAKSRGSVHDTTADAHLTPRSASLKERALAMLNEPSKPTPLGRRHTMPTLQAASSPLNPSRTSAGRTSSKTYSRGHGLSAVQEAEE